MSLKNILHFFIIISFIFSGIQGVYAAASTQNGINNSDISQSEKIISAKELRKQMIKEKIREILKERRNQMIREKIKEIRQARAEKLILENKKNSIANRQNMIVKVQVETIELNSASEKKQYPDYLDISNNLKYKRIQEKALSCELSATSDILSYFEKQNISEITIINNVDKSEYNQLPKIENGVKIWGNPNAGYVGFIDMLPDGEKATQSGMTGYGVLEKPIAKIYDTYNYKNKIITNKNYSINYSQRQHLSEILGTINEGNMVQLWGDYCTTPKYEDTNNKNHCKFLNKERKLTWFYKENGKLIKYEGLAGEHAFYLLGYKGGIQNPTHIIVWDTLTGKHTFRAKEWIRKWNKMDNKSIIIYKK